MKRSADYLLGFGNTFESESVEGALPKNQNSPRKVPLGLYAEQLSGTAFTVPRSENRRTWFYRIRPSVLHGAFHKQVSPSWKTIGIDPDPSPQQLRWDPWPQPVPGTDFFESLCTLVRNGSPLSRQGIAIHVYSASHYISDRYWSNSDGEFLIVPEKGKLEIATECGVLDIEPCEIGVVPRGMKFQVRFQDPWVRGYICENFGEPFRLPSLGLIGANGLADARHFLTPKAQYEDKEGNFEWWVRFQGNTFKSALGHSPLDVVAWHGNYVPYKYDLQLFQPVNSVRVDHPDPSIFTVLTSPSAVPGQAHCDFVLFPPRWMVAQDTFRPPYYHRNLMSEWMGLIKGQYDAKQEGFLPGGSSLHNCMAAHGPDADTAEKAFKVGNEPYYLDNTLAIMFESCYPYQVTDAALKSLQLQKNYLACWSHLKKHFPGSPA